MNDNLEPFRTNRVVRNMPSTPTTGIWHSFLSASLALAMCVLLSASVLAQEETITYFSRANGDIETTSNWSSTGHSDPSCSCTPGCAVTGRTEVTVQHQITSACNLSEIYGNTVFTVSEGGQVIIEGNLEVYGDAQYNIAPEGAVTVNGNLNVYGNGKITLSGSLTVKGDVKVTGNGKVCGQGNAVVSGGITGAGWCYSISVQPTELLSLKAQLTDAQQVNLHWEPVADIPSDRFTIERSDNGMSYFKVGSVAADHNQHDYGFNDVPAQAGTYYYKLTQVSSDGSAVASQVVVVTLKDDESDLCTLEVEPNPCVPWCEARLIDCPDGNFRTYVMDASGNVISELIPHSEGYNGIRYHINRDNYLMPGIYIIEAHNREARLSKKIIVK